MKAIIILHYPLVRLAQEIDGKFLGRRFSSVCRIGTSEPPSPTRLVVGLLILKHRHNLSDEPLCERWMENPYFQYLCGEEVFRNDSLAADARWRQRLGEERNRCAAAGELFGGPPRGGDSIGPAA